MEEEIIKIEEGQYLADIMEFIPENAIIRKTLPGIGATQREITSKRNSIIIEPNVPVIEGKIKTYPNILGVIEGVTKQNVISYIESDVEFKKIITTPESYFKVQEAFKRLNINYFEEYFLLFDECERITQDIDYRNSIDAPMEDFWNFKKRSFISATPIKPTSNEFTAQGFKFVTIEPNYEYKKEINIFKTYNVLAMVKEGLFKVIKSPEKIVDEHCYFINSLDMIHCIIKDLEIKEICNIYCSTSAIRKLKAQGYENAFSSLTPLNKINFFTSRFFSAVDIELKTKPFVTMVTDVEFAIHSMIIPQTEAVQIVGRFRNGVSYIEHITNVNPFIPLKSLNEVKEEIKDSYETFKTIFTFYKNAQKKGEKDLISDMLKNCSFAKLLTPNMEINWFKYENALVDQIVKNIYHDLPHLLDAYDNSEFFIRTELDFNTFTFTDKKYFRRSGNSKKSIRKEIVAELEEIDRDIIDESIYLIEKLSREDPLIVNAYIELGIDYIEKVNYNEKDLKIALVKKAFERGEYKFPLITAVLETFKVNEKYTENEINRLLNKIYLQFECEPTAKTTDLIEYFNLSKRTSMRKYGIEEKGYTILSAKINNGNLGQNPTLLIQSQICPGFTIQ